MLNAIADSGRTTGMASTDNGRKRIDKLILEVLQETEGELTAKDLEIALSAKGEAADPHAIRDAIWRLIADREAVLTPQRTLKAS